MTLKKNVVSTSFSSPFTSSYLGLAILDPQFLFTLIYFHTIINCVYPSFLWPSSSSYLFYINFYSHYHCLRVIFPHNLSTWPNHLNLFSFSILSTIDTKPQINQFLIQSYITLVTPNNTTLTFLSLLHLPSVIFLNFIFHWPLLSTFQFIQLRMTAASQPLYIKSTV